MRRSESVENFKINKRDISIRNAKLNIPKTQDVKWDPEEYKIIRINTDEGIIEFLKTEKSWMDRFC